MMEKMRIVKIIDGVAKWMLINGDTTMFFDVVEFEDITTRLRSSDGRMVGMLILSRTVEFKALWEALE